MTELSTLTAYELHNLLKDKKATSVEITQSCIDKINQTDGKINAFITVLPEKALEQARSADEYISKNSSFNPLHGIPIAVKDNICTKDIKTTCASNILSNFVPTYDATVIKKIKDAGCIILGKTNLDEFAMGSSTENSAFFTTKNPHDTSKVPGGSSGGSAASSACNQTIISLGSDTGGSVRQPGAFTGTFALKPTYGAVSRYGLVAFASSLDQIGPITKCAKDASVLLNVISGFDEKDSTSVNTPHPDYTKALNQSVKGLKIGIDENLFNEGLDTAVKNKITEAVNIFKELGAEIVKIKLTDLNYALASYYIIAPSEASSNLARYDGARYGIRDKSAGDIITMFKKSRYEGFGNEVKRRIMIGTYALSAGYYEAYYKKAQKVRFLIKESYNNALKNCDLILTPTTPTLPFNIGEKIEDPLKMYLSDIYTISVNLAGLPAASLCCGYHGNLPVGMQLIGKNFDEFTILKAGDAFESAAGHYKQLRKL
ncbi:MAG: Asp-tRNA(Asn)/Glu-tRNA(Gln) amidotransferase subunit GatA [Armatimonadota bacterium]